MNLPEALASLGNNAEEVADTLRKKGIKGRKSSRCDCPIAQYLKKVCNISSVLVNVGQITTYDNQFATPAAVRNFIRQFDLTSRRDEFWELT